MAQDAVASGIEEVRAHWQWFLAMGIVLIVVGTIAIGATELMTIVSVPLLGWLLIIAGIFEIAHGITRRQWSGFFINVLGGVLYAVAGLLIILNPAMAAVTLTLLIAMILIVAGIFRLFIAFTTGLHHRAWVIVNGAISVILGFMIWDSWPFSGTWVIGMFVGIDMIFDGWTEVMLALQARGVPPLQPQAATA